jgi:hypothetical protein
MAASEPGQKKQADRSPCRTAVTQIGSPPHHEAFRTAPVSLSRNHAFISGSYIVFDTMPWCFGRRPVAIV